MTRGEASDAISAYFAERTARELEPAGRTS